MNIFTTSYNPRKAARSLDDARLGKMILETSQILCTVLNLEAGHQVTPYRTAHASHPAVKWARESSSNFNWLWKLGDELGKEFQHRRGKTHASHNIIRALSPRPSPKPISWYNGARHGSLLIDYTHKPVKQAYRAYLNHRWALQERKPRWTKRGPPPWYQPNKKVAGISRRPSRVVP